jgi:hypothetical protein
MLNRIPILMMLLLALSACASHKARQVDCDVALRPINRPVPVDTPASTLPSSDTDMKKPSSLVPEAGDD